MRKQYIDRHYIKFEKFSIKSRKRKYLYFKYNNKAKKLRKFKINYLFLFVIFFASIFILISIFKYYKKKSKEKKGYAFISNFSENQEYFNDLIKEINTNKKYKEEKYCYYNDDESCLYKYLCPKKVVGKNLKLFGLLRDGSYVLTDDLKDITIAYSFGIDGEISFDLKIADEGIDVYMYDPYIYRLHFPNLNKSPNKDFRNDINYYQKKFHFFKIGIADSHSHKANMKTLEAILKENGHMDQKNMILKMDIEGAEWNVLRELSEDILQKFKYITLELHIPEKPEEYHADIFKKLSKHHQVIYIRCNNNNGKIIKFGKTKIWKYIELTYMIKEGNEFIRDNSIYPLKEFYFKNNDKMPDEDYNLNILKLFYTK